jgi:hypothetical protein
MKKEAAIKCNGLSNMTSDEKKKGTPKMEGVK